jgi:prophage regulatory protein
MPQQVHQIEKKGRKVQPLEAANNPHALLQFATVCDLAGLSRATIHRLIQKGQFVEPVRLSSRCTRFRASEVNAWLASK